MINLIGVVNCLNKIKLKEIGNNSVFIKLEHWCFHILLFKFIIGGKIMNWRKVKKVCEFIEDKSIHAIFLIINELIGMSMMFESHQIWISILGVILIVVSFILSNIEYKLHQIAIDKVKELDLMKNEK